MFEFILIFNYPSPFQFKEAILGSYDVGKGIVGAGEIAGKEFAMQIRQGWPFVAAKIRISYIKNLEKD